MSRIIAGVARGRRLAVPAGNLTRPTTDRVREAMFSALDSALDGFEGIRVLDLYAGSGGNGLEALSRGAEELLLVEADARAAAVLRKNVATVGLPGAKVIVAKVERILRTPPQRRFDLVLLDPPYPLTNAALDTVLATVVTDWAAVDALIVVERFTRSAPPQWPPGITPIRSRTYGETTLHVGQVTESS